MTLFNDDIAIVTTRAVYVAGTAHPEGARLKLPPARAYEAVVIVGFARFADPEDADRAQQAFAAEQAAEIRRIGGDRWPSHWPVSPWRPLRL
jgi:hypothetical protein